MTTLKAINKTIEEGNDDLEELNTNFKKWFEVQKRNRLDDLEAAREAKRAMKVIGAGAITGSGGSGGGGSGDDESDSKIPGILKSILGTLVAGSVIKRIFRGSKTPKTTPKTNAPKTNTIINKLQAKLDELKIKNIKFAITEAQILNDENRNRRNIENRNARMNKYGSRFSQATIDRSNLARRTPYGPDSGKGERVRTSRFNQLKIDIQQEKIAKLNRANLLKRISYGVGSGEAARLSGLKFNPAMETARPTSRNRGLFTQGMGSGVADPFRVRPTNTAMRMSRPATVTSSTGNVYDVNSRRGRQVIDMTKRAADAKNSRSFRNASNRLGQANIVAPKAVVVPAAPTGTSKTSSIFAGLGGGGGSITQGPPRATGNILKDIKNLHAYRKGLAPKPWALNCQTFAVKFLGKVVAPLMALEFYMAMTGPMFNFKTMQFEPELSTDGKIEYAASIFTGLVGASIGASVGSFLGTFAIPIPGIGTLAGGLIGGYVGFLAGAELGRFVARYLMSVRPPEMEHKKMLAVMGKFKAARHTSLANKMIGMNASTQRELGLYGDTGNLTSKTFTATSSLTSQQNNPNTRQALLNTLAAGGISRQLETGGIGSAGTSGAHFTNLALPPTGDRLNRIDHINSQNNSFMANAMRGFSSAGRDGGGFFNQSNNANDNSTTHHHNYGSNQIRHSEGGGGQSVITDKMMFF